MNLKKALVLAGAGVAAFVLADYITDRPAVMKLHPVARVAIGSASVAVPFVIVSAIVFKAAKV